MAVLEACGGQKAGVVHRFRDDAGAAHRGCRVLEAGEEEKASVQALNAEWLARGMKGYSGLLRVKDRDRLMVENADCLGPVPGIGNFRHTTSIGHFRFLKNLGYRDEFTRTYSQGGTLFSDLLLGHGFVLASRPMEGMECVLSREGMYLYRLPGARWGLVVPQGALGLRLDGER